MAATTRSTTVLRRHFQRLFQRVCFSNCHDEQSFVTIRPLSYSLLRFYSSKTQQDDEFEFENEEDFDREMEIEKLRDVSRLSVRNRARTHRYFNSADLQPKDDDYSPKFWLKRNKRLYAKYGSASGVNPAILWPTKEQLQETIDTEAEWEPTLEEMLAKVKAEKAEKSAYIKKREEKILKNMAKMPELIKQYEARIEKKVEERKKHEAKRKQLMEEAREFFGYDIDPRDEKFKKMQEEKAIREQEEAKKRKKAEKLAKMTARLVNTSVGK